MPSYRTNVMHVSRALAIACCLIPLVVSAASAQTPERSPTEGLKETERFIKAGGSTSGSVASARVEVEKTLTAYNNLVTQPSKNMKSDYKKLLKSMDSMNKKVTDATTKIAAMQSAADTYFAGRSGTIKTIQDPVLHKQAQERMEQSQKDFGDVLALLRQAGGALDPFRKQLADQIKFLGSDLNPSATASLKPQADRLNADGAAVFSGTDQAISKSNVYFDGLKSQS